MTLLYRHTASDGVDGGSLIRTDDPISAEKASMSILRHFLMMTLLVGFGGLETARCKITVQWSDGTDMFALTLLTSSPTLRETTRSRVCPPR